MEQTFSSQCYEHIESFIGQSAPRKFTELVVRVLFRLVYPFYKIDELSQFIFQDTADIKARPFSEATISLARDIAYGYLLRRTKERGATLIFYICASAAQRRGNPTLSPNEAKYLAGSVGMREGCEGTFCQVVSAAFRTSTFPVVSGNAHALHILDEWGKLIAAEHHAREGIQAEYTSTFPKSTTGYTQTVGLRWRPKAAPAPPERPRAPVVVAPLGRAAPAPHAANGLGTRLSASDKQRCLGLEGAPREDIDEAQWRTDRTRLVALRELHSLRDQHTYQRACDVLPARALPKRSSQFRMMLEDGHLPCSAPPKRKSQKHATRFEVIQGREERHNCRGSFYTSHLSVVDRGTGERHSIYMRQRFLRRRRARQGRPMDGVRCVGAAPLGKQAEAAAPTFRVPNDEAPARWWEDGESD